MSFQEDIYDKIEAYLSGELDADQLAAFENEISMDNSLKAEIEKHKTVNALIVEQRLLSVTELLQAEKIKDANSGGSLNSYVYLAIAVAGLGIGSYILMDKKEDVASNDVQATPTIVKMDSADGAKNTSKKSVDYLTNEESINTIQIENGFRKSQIQFVEQQINESVQNVTLKDTAVLVKQKPIEQTSTVEPNVNVVTKPVVSTMVPCANVHIQASVKSNPSCIDEENGNIVVHSIQGGKKPYAISLRASNQETPSNGALSKGTYQVIVADADGCIQTYSNIVVSEKDCPKDYAFNPYIGEEWTMAAANVDGQLEMHNKAGVLYYQTTIHAQTPLQWSGMGLNNQVIPGYYIFVIKYSNGTYKKGSVTIVQ